MLDFIQLEGVGQRLVDKNAYIEGPNCIKLWWVLHGSIYQTLVHSLHCLLNFEIGGLKLDCHVITSLYHLSIEYTCNTFL